MNPHEQQMDRALYGLDDQSPMPPGVFVEQMARHWARVWNEVAFELKEVDLPWRDRRVMAAFSRLVGFDPWEIAYSSELAPQQRALRTARELSLAIFQADEVEQLDGDSALSYAHGWMLALRYLFGLPACLPDKNSCGKSKCPSVGHIETVMRSAVDVYRPEHADQFCAGFQKCLDVKLQENRCYLQCKP